MRTTVVEKFKEILAKYPDKEAVVHESERVTFRHLSCLSMQIKRLISGSNLSNKIVAVFLPKSVALVAADIAVLSFGAAFMNLDCKLPQPRLAALLANVKPDIIVTDKKTSEKYNEALKVCQLVYVDGINTETDVDFELETSDIIDTDPFCVINTSGSTGVPKSVVLSQLNFLDFLNWTEETYEFDGETRIGCLTPVYFDIFVFELCQMMTKGAALVLLDAKYASFPIQVLQKLKEERITFIFWVPTIMVNIANAKLLDEVEPHDLKTVWFAGEVFPTKQFNYWYDKLPNTQFTNLYGPIEIAVDCTYYIIDKRQNENEPLPIGVPCRNTDILILNDDNKLCKTNEEGELCVRGSSLALGYYNDLDKTTAVFVQNPLNTSYPERIYHTGDLVYQREDGLIMFVGRKDSLIKHSGYRIELGEIEHLLVNQCKLVKNCCAVYPKKRKEIVLFYESEKEIERAIFFRNLGMYVPKYMIPQVYVRKDKMPQNNNGKIDRLALAAEGEIC